MSRGTVYKAGYKVRAFVARATWAGLACVPICLPAFADDSAQQPSKPAEKSEPLAEVVVTGSRIARQDYTALTPIVTVDAAAIEARSDIGIESALQQLPQFHASQNGSSLSLSSDCPNVGGPSIRSSLQTKFTSPSLVDVWRSMSR